MDRVYREQSECCEFLPEVESQHPCRNALLCDISNEVMEQANEAAMADWPLFSLVLDLKK